MRAFDACSVRRGRTRSSTECAGQPVATSGLLYLGESISIQMEAESPMLHGGTHLADFKRFELQLFDIDGFAALQKLAFP